MPIVIADPGRIKQFRALWRELHTERDADQKWLERFTARIPCGDCRAHWLALLNKRPPVFGAGWFKWTWEIHQDVNQSLKKPGLTLEEATDLYREQVKV